MITLCIHYEIDYRKLPEFERYARKFFTPQEVSEAELLNLERAWIRSVQLHITLWSRPYTKDGSW